MHIEQPMATFCFLSSTLIQQDLRLAKEPKRAVAPVAFSEAIFQAYQVRVGRRNAFQGEESCLSTFFSPNTLLSISWAASCLSFAGPEGGEPGGIELLAHVIQLEAIFEKDDDMLSARGPRNLQLFRRERWNHPNSLIKDKGSHTGPL